jgi:3-oxoacyl-[acyl-carrier-protein] synthase II
LRVAITGVGLVCALGNDVETVWQRLVRGERGIGPVTLFPVEGQKTSIAAEVKDLAVPAGPPPWSRTDALALHAAKQALIEAKLDAHAESGLRIGLVVGGTTGGMFETEALLARMHDDPRLRVPDPAMLAHPLSATADRLGATLGPFARARSICSACSSGANAFAIGRAWLELDLVDAVLVGGTDGLCRLTFTGFNALGAIDAEPARPFDARRKGLSLGEGAGFAVLERDDRARARGLSPAVELVGIGIVSEAHHITNPSSDGAHAAAAMTAALKDAGLQPSDVDYVNAHGTATSLNDAMESAAIVRALEGQAERVFVSSTKGQIGHTLGAAGAIEAIFTALAIRESTLPPTAGLEQIDPKCAPLRHVPKDGARGEVRVALSNGFGFGGVDTVLAFARAGYAKERNKKPRGVWITGIGSASRIGALQWDDNAKLVEPRPKRDRDDPIPDDATVDLDPARARRLDRAARLAATAAHFAWTSGGDGILLGTSYGDADGSAAFLAKIFEKGPRLAPPAEFPNLVPSSPSGHVSIYLGLHGPAITLADITTSGEAAVATAYELIASGQMEATSAGSAEGPSEIAASCLAPVFRGAAGEVEPDSHDRTEGSAVVRLTREPGPEAQLEEKLVLRQVVQAADAATAVRAIEAPFGKAGVVVGEWTEPVRAALEGTVWAKVPLREVVHAVGRHEGLGGFAIAAAAALLLKRTFDSILVLGASPGRSYAFLLERL